MVDLTDVESVRLALASMCRDPAKRIIARNLELENFWAPYTVRNPDTFMPFTDAGAWDFIADCLEANVKTTCIPPSEKYPDHAYYLVEGARTGQAIYMKIAIRPGLKHVIGVSFHNSKHA
jgi:hypothetical protein